MDNRDRRCSLCGLLNPPTVEFCGDCGTLLRDLPVSKLSRTQQTQFALPDYLLQARERDRAERRRRMTVETGDGIGLLWAGGIAAVLSLWFGGGVGPGAPIFLGGVGLALLGLWRLRRDARNMARAGTATVVVASVVLGAALVQTVGYRDDQIVVPEPAVTDPTPTPDPVEQPVQAQEDLGGVPMFRGNAARTGVNPGPAPLERPLVKWKSFVGGETYASPVVGLNSVYVATKSGSLVALGLDDGEERWRVDVGDYIARSTPALADGKLFVAAGYALLAIDAETGQLQWRAPLRFAGSCSPVVAGGMVYVATQEGHVSAFTADTGEERWHYRNDNLLFGSPAVGDDVVIFADEAGRVTALEADTGRELWQEGIDGEVFSTPAIAQGLVYVATNAPLLVAFDTDTGVERWRRAFGGASSPATADGVVFLGGADQSLRALDAESGVQRWSSSLGYAIQSSATITDEAIFIGSGPTLNAVSRGDGRTLWTHVTGGDVTADLAAVAGMVIASSHDGYVYALAEPDEDTVAARELPKSVGGVLLRGSR